MVTLGGITRGLGAVPGSYKASHGLRTAINSAASVSRPILKVAINILSQSPGHSTGALSWFLQFARLVPKRDPGTDYVLIVGREDVPYFRGKSPTARVVGAGWGNSRRALRVLSEHLLLSAA